MFRYHGVVLAGVSVLVFAAPVPGQAVRLPNGQVLAEINFERHVHAVLDRQGCNAGGCHGSSRGKGSFVLSLIAESPERDHEGYQDGEVPAERTLRDILNRMNYRLKRIQKGKPLKKTKDTDAIFAKVAAVKAEVSQDAASLEISMDTKVKVAPGDYSRGGKNPDECGRGSDPGMGP